MKKMIAIITVLVVAAALLAGCKNDKMTFTATVKEPGDSSILVIPSEGSNELNSSDLITVHVSDGTKILDENEKKGGIDIIKAGITVEITYNGVTAESYPAQIAADVIRIT
jgi:ABC-type glycerol-3-phosphate transport system substrate-binding protein